TAKLASDVLRLYAVETDPEDQEAGDIWYNSTQNILKMFNGEEVVALQAETFDWGYYPPGGVDLPDALYEASAENPGEEGVLGESAIKTTFSGGSGTT